MENNSTKPNVTLNPLQGTAVDPQKTINNPGSDMLIPKVDTDVITKSKKFLFFIIILLIVIFMPLFWLMIRSYRSQGGTVTITPILTSSGKDTENQKEINSAKPNDSVTSGYEQPESEQPDIDWIIHTEDGLGFSFKIPKGWNFVSGRSDNSVDFDILSPDKEMFVGIAVFIDERITKGMSIEDAISEKETELKANETYKLTDFKSSVQGSEGRYVAEGEEWYLNFANENAWQESDGLIYRFVEKGLFRTDGKSVYLHSIVLPDSPMRSTAAKIIDSFELK
jgi:hypothetical protein